MFIMMMKSPDPVIYRAKLYRKCWIQADGPRKV